MIKSKCNKLSGYCRVAALIAFALFACASLPAQHEGTYTFSPGGQWYIMNGDNSIFLNTDSLSLGKMTSAIEVRGQKNILHLYDDGRTVIFIKDFQLVKGVRDGHLIIVVDTLCTQPVDPQIFEMTSDEKYILITSTTIKNSTYDRTGFQNVLLLVKSGDQYEVADSIGNKEKGRFVVSADIGLNGVAAYKDNYEEWKYFRLDANNKFQPYELDQLTASCVDIPDNCSDIFFITYDPVNYFCGVTQMRYRDNSYDTAFAILDQADLGTGWYSDFGFSIDIAPDGKTIAWIVTKHEFFKQSEKNQFSYEYQFVNCIRAIDNQHWSAASKYFDLISQPEYAHSGSGTLFSRIYTTNHGITCTREFGTIVHYPSHEVNANPVVLPFTNFYPRGITYGPCNYHVVISDTATEGVMHSVRFVIRNNETYPMQFRPYYQEDQQFKVESPVPVYDPGQTTPVYLQTNTNTLLSNVHYELIEIMPGDSVEVICWMKFMYSGESADLYLSPVQSNCNAQIMLTATATRVEKAKIAPLIGTKYFNNGKRMEELNYDSISNTWKFKRWYSNGSRCMDVTWDAEGELTGESYCYHDNDSISTYISINGKNKTHIRYYPNGQKKSEHFYRNEREIGVARSWYENGALKSEAKFRSHVVFNVYTYKIKIAPRMGSSAKYYYEYYQSGNKKYDAFHSWGGKRKRTWHYYYDNKNSEVICTYLPGKTGKSIANNASSCFHPIDWTMMLPQLFYSGFIFERGWIGRHGPGKF